MRLEVSHDTPQANSDMVSTIPRVNISVMPALRRHLWWTKAGVAHLQEAALFGPLSSPSPTDDTTRTERNRCILRCRMTHRKLTLTRDPQYHGQTYRSCRPLVDICGGPKLMLHTYKKLRCSVRSAGLGRLMIQHGREERASMQTRTRK